MAECVLDTNRLRSYADKISMVNQRLNRLDWRIRSLYGRVGLIGLSRLIQANALLGYNWRLSRAQNYLNQTAQDFEQAERAIQNWKEDRIINSARELLEFWIKYLQREKDWFRHLVIGTGVAVGAAASAVPDSLWDMFWKGDLKYEDKDGHVTRSGFFSPTYGTYEQDDMLGDKDHWNVNVEQKKVDGKQINKDEKFYDKKGTILEAGTEKKVQVSVAEDKTEGKSKYAQGSAEYRALTAEAHAGATAGMYVYEKDANGKTKRIFSPGVAAEVGASVAAFEAAAEGRVGLGEDNNMLGVYGNVEVEVASAEVKGKVALNRKEIFAGASAEANVAKIEGSAGVSVLGTDVGITAAAKFGIGAHANVGYTDGKFKVDVGAALGPGFDLGFEVDVSGTVKAVSGACESAWNGLKSLGSNIGKGFRGLFG